MLCLNKRLQLACHSSRSRCVCSLLRPETLTMCPRMLTGYTRWCREGWLLINNGRANPLLRLILSHWQTPWKESKLTARRMLRKMQSTSAGSGGTCRESLLRWHRSRRSRVVYHHLICDHCTRKPCYVTNKGVTLANSQMNRNSRRRSHHHRMFHSQCSASSTQR